MRAVSFFAGLLLLVALIGSELPVLLRVFSGLGSLVFLAIAAHWALNPNASRNPVK